jgi:hypothetical protein
VYHITEAEFALFFFSSFLRLKAGFSLLSEGFVSASRIERGVACSLSQGERLQVAYKSL